MEFLIPGMIPLNNTHLDTIGNKNKYFIHKYKNIETNLLNSYNPLLLLFINFFIIFSE